MIMKFPIEPDDKDIDFEAMIANEVARWHQLGFPTVASIKVMNRIALILPFTFHYIDDEQQINDS